MQKGRTRLFSVRHFPLRDSEYAKSFNYDLDAIFADLPKKEAENGRGKLTIRTYALTQHIVGVNGRSPLQMAL